MGTTRIRVSAFARLLLASFGLAVVWLVVSFTLGGDSARADDRDSPSLVSGIADTVEKPLTSVVTPMLDSVVAPIAKPVTEAAPRAAAPVAPVVAPVQSKLTEVVDANPVSGIVAPVVGTVDAVVAPVVTTVDAVAGTIPTLDRVLPVSDIVGSTPLSDVTAPVTGVVDEVLGDIAGSAGVLTPAPVVSGPIVPALPWISDPTLSAGGSASIADVAATSRVLPAPSVSSWAADVNFRADTSPAASARTRPDTAPHGPADNGNSAVPTPSGTSSGAASGGPSGSGSAVQVSSVLAAALISGALLSHAENDALPSSFVRDLSSTPD